ncbi:unnamed protein product [Prorocentrum cordatum]|uniref:RanBP2-type domain-containing protein n=1 Tax=Prorocentrum cordatum TaxID=2364126 RepID=A0ABN9UH37_9DINO|nr:unnamed protein product [Polarella glacialis]
MAGNGAGTLLLGPKRPHWGCPRCGTANKWACRLQCRCGARAPQRIISKARHEDNNAKADVNPKGQPPSRGGGSGGGRLDSSQLAPWATSKLEKELVALRKQVQQLKSEKNKAPAPHEAAPNGTSEAAVEVDGSNVGAKDTTATASQRNALQVKIGHYEQFVKSLALYEDSECEQLLTAKKQLESLRVQLRELRPPSTAHKVATQKPERCRAQLDRFRTEAADRREKIAKLQEKLDIKEAATVQKELRIANGFVVLAAAVLPLFEREERWARLRPVQRNVHVQRTGWHEWQRAMLGEQCRKCLCIAGDTHDKPLTGCRGMPVYLAQFVCNPLGHTLIAVSQGGRSPASPGCFHPLYVCSKCGAWAQQSRRNKLRRPCGPPTRKGLEVLVNLRNGVGPHKRLARVRLMPCSQPSSLSLVL